MQKMFLNISVKTALKNIKKWYKYRIFCKISQNQYKILAQCQNNGFEAKKSTIVNLFPQKFVILLVLGHRM